MVDEDPSKMLSFSDAFDGNFGMAEIRCLARKSGQACVGNLCMRQIHKEDIAVPDHVLQGAIRYPE